MDTVSVYCTREIADWRDRDLVLTAAGIAHEAVETDSGFEILVEIEDAPRAASELAVYAHENPGQPRPALPGIPHHDPLAGVVAYVLVLLVLDILAGSQAAGLDWGRAGSAGTASIRAGEWWRTFTALTLHVDTLHLAGNLVFGGWFGWIAGRRLGPGLSWCMILLGGALGNAINAFVQSPSHVSVGASTAVFAALGILAFDTWRSWDRSRSRPAQRWAPIVSAIVLLGFLGMSGERTDFVAHIAGFAAGALLGALACPLARRGNLRGWHQSALGLAALSGLVLAWGLALTS